MLATILSRLVDAALAKPAQPFQHHFANGLRITVVFYKQTYQFNLVLARDRVLPSLTEFKTILKNWPYPTRANPAVFDNDDRHYLVAMLPAHEKLL